MTLTCDMSLKNVKFGMSVLLSHPSPVHRHFTESVLIYRNEKNLISESQYDSCVIPRFSVFIGQKTGKEEEVNENHDDDNAFEDIGKERKKN